MLYQLSYARVLAILASLRYCLRGHRSTQPPAGAESPTS